MNYVWPVFACFLMEFSSKGPKYTMQLASVCLDLILSFKICCQGCKKLQVLLFFPVIFLVVLNLFYPILKLILASRPQCCHQHRLSGLCFAPISVLLKNLLRLAPIISAKCVWQRASYWLKNSWQLPAAAVWLCFDDCQMFLHIMCHEQPNLTSVRWMNWERGVWLLRFLPRFYYHFAPILLRL